MAPKSTRMPGSARHRGGKTLPSQLKRADILDAAVIAIADFSAAHADELSFAKNDVLMLIGESSFQSPPDGWLYARNDFGKHGLVPANYLVSMATTAPNSSWALTDCGDEVGQTLTANWISELQNDVMRTARRVVIEQVREQTRELLAAQDERGGDLKAQIEHLKEEAAASQQRHDQELELKCKQSRTAGEEHGQRLLQEAMVAFERQRDESARECDRLRAVATWEMSMRKIAEERTDSLRAELDQAKEEIEQLQSRLEGNEEAEHVAATLHELRVALASSRSLASEAEVAATAARLTKQASERALQDAIEQFSRHKGIPIPSIPAGRIITLKNLKAYNVPNRDSGRGKDVSDPYAIVKLLDDHGNAVDDECTKYVRNQRNPAWGDVLTMPVPPHITFPPSISVEIWDKDWTKPDEFIGKTRIALDPSELGRGRVHNCAVPIRGSGHGKEVSNDMTFDCWYQITPELVRSSVSVTVHVHVHVAHTYTRTHVPCPYSRIHACPCDDPC